MDFNAAVSWMMRLFTSREVAAVSLLAKYSTCGYFRVLSNE